MSSDAVKTNQRKWGKATIAAGFTIVPNMLLEKAHALSLEPIDVCILLLLVKHWWTAEKAPYPSKRTLATALGCTPRTIQRRLAYLENDLKLIVREKREGVLGTNTFHLDKLVAALTPFADEANAEREAREQEKTERLKRKRPKVVTNRARA